MFGKLCSAIDLFGTPVVFNSSKSQGKSTFGGCCSLCFLAFLVLITGITSSELFTHNQPIIINGSTYSQTPRPVEISSKKLPLAFGIQGSNSEMTSKFCAFRYYTTAENGTQNAFREMKRCQPEDFTSDSTPANMSGLWCFPHTPEFLPATTVSIAALCPTQEGIGDFFSSLPIAVAVYPRNGLTLHDYKSPLQLYFDIDFIPLVANTTVISAWSLSYLNITTDDGWLFANRNLDQYVQVTNDYSRNLPNEIAPGIIYSFSVSKQETYYTRTYIRLQDVLAEIGGIANTVFAVLSVIVMPISKIKLVEAFINEFFEVKRKKLSKSVERKKENRKQELVKKPSKDKYQVTVHAPGSTKQKNAQGVQLQNLSNPRTLKTENIAINRAFTSGFSPKSKASEEAIKSPHHYETERLLFPKKQEEEPKKEIISKVNKNPSTPEKPRLIDRRVHTHPVKSTPWPQLESSGLTDKDNLVNENENSIIGLEELIGPSGSKINFSGQIRSKTNVQEMDLASKNQQISLGDIESRIAKKEENIVEEEARELHYRNKDDIKIAKPYNKSVAFDKKEQTISKQSKTKQPERFKISIFEYCWSFVSKSELLKEKMVILKEGMETLDERLDIFNALKKIRDIDKMKGLLLDKDQLVLFNVTPRPDVMSRATHWYKEDSLSDDTVAGGIEDHIKSAQERIEQRPNKSEIDYTLLCLVSDRCP